MNNYTPEEFLSDFDQFWSDYNAVRKIYPDLADYRGSLYYADAALRRYMSDHYVQRES